MKTSRPAAALSRRAFVQASGAALVGALALPALAPSRATAAPGKPVAPRPLQPMPRQVTWGTGLLRLSGRAVLRLAAETDAALVRSMQETWQRFTLGALPLAVERDATLRSGEFALGGGRPPARVGEATYALAVDEAGLGASAADAASVRHAWYTTLQLLQASGPGERAGAFALPYVTIQDWPALAFRGIHLCVFPETSPVILEKAIRLAACLKLTHVVLEFWGTLRLAALRELSWPRAWSKEQAGALIGIARGMGLEVVPMFNCWGHAAASRYRFGRHVVLDQNPQLAPLFEPDGWTWCLSNPRTQALLREVCDELIALAGPGTYFHLGCDEARSHATCDTCRTTDRVQLLVDHVNRLADFLAQRGRRPILWGDSLLERAKWQPAGLEANGTPELPTHRALDRLSRHIVIADWQYEIKKGDLPTLGHLQAQGFATLGCPWEQPDNIRTVAQAALAQRCAGVLLTTWDRLPQYLPTLPFAASCLWTDRPKGLPAGATAALLRKLVPAEGDFDRAGWSAYEQPPAGS